MPIMNTFTHYIAIAPIFYGTFPDPPGEPITWTSGGMATGNFVVHSGENGLLDANTDTDFWFNSNHPYTGYVVEVEGETYAVFMNTTNNILYIPYNKEEVDLAPFFEFTPGGTSAYQPAGAQVFNCFATGTTILTPDGERAIETLKPGDRVVTHDGRSAPVIWVARQTVANPRGVELGRKPVRHRRRRPRPGPAEQTADRDRRPRIAVRRHAGQRRHAGGGRNSNPLPAAFGDADALRLVACGA